MEIIFERFPSLGKKVISLLDYKSLVLSKEVNKTWKNFIEKEKTIWIRIIQKHVQNVNDLQDWKNSVSKISTNSVKQLAIATGLFYKSEQSKGYEKWSPLHIAVDSGNLKLSQNIIEKMENKNPKNDKGGDRCGISGVL